MKSKLPVKRLREGAKVPSYATEGAAGLDIYACLDIAMEIAPGAVARVPSGVAVAIQEGYVGLVRDRSSLAVAGLHTVAGVIDSDYRGEILVALHNLATSPQIIRPGDRIAQMLIIPCSQALTEETDDLPATQRGDGGFGSTGR